MITAVIWGLEEVLFKEVLNNVDVFSVIVLRTLISALGLTIYMKVISIFSKRSNMSKVKRKKRNKKYYICIFSMAIALCIHYVLGLYGLSMTQANLSCFLNIGLNSLVTSSLLAIFIKSERKGICRSFSIISFLIAFMGTYMLIIGNNETTIDYGIVLVILSTIAWGIYILIYELIDYKLSVIEINRNVSLICFIIMTIFMCLTGRISLLLNLPFDIIMKIVVASIIVDIGTVFTYYIGIRIISGVKANVVILMSPLISLIFAYLVLGEVVSGNEEIGCILLFLSSTTVVIDEYIEYELQKEKFLNKLKSKIKLKKASVKNV